MLKKEVLKRDVLKRDVLKRKELKLPNQMNLQEDYIAFSFDGVESYRLTAPGPVSYIWQNHIAYIYLFIIYLSYSISI